MKNPRDIEEIEPGYKYSIPIYGVTDEGVDNKLEDREYAPFLIPFCKGDKSDPNKPRQLGVFVESLLEVCVKRLQAVNVGELATRDTSIAITHIEDAILRLNKRSEDRKVRNVEGTYQK